MIVWRVFGQRTGVFTPLMHTQEYPVLHIVSMPIVFNEYNDGKRYEISIKEYV